MSAQPVLVLVPGVTGASADGAPFARADEAAAQLTVIDLGVTRGDGIFETVGVFDGAPQNLGPHLRRLARSAEMLELPAPDLGILEEAFALAVAEHEDVPELSVRVVMTRGDEGTGVPTAWIHARESADWSRERAGIRVSALSRGLPSTVVADSPWLLAGAKTLSYAGNMSAVREAKRRGDDDVLFVSTDGYALEGPTSTLLVRLGETFVTTPLSAGVLQGTCVASVFEMLAAAGRTTGEKLLTPAEVLASDGAWLLSSTRLVAPITHLDGQELPVDAELTARLLAHLRGA
ncbi:aminotransferase class IV [Brachybacterium hainanense]|uniref:Aminotransferase class IV n=1 Tax=Brachybacterium hainanense TaxID=1541174 RepID=A0ABV6R647_9MICO